MKKDTLKYAQDAFKLGQINGKCFLVVNYLKNALYAIDEGWDVKSQIKDALREVKAIKKLAKSI